MKVIIYILFLFPLAIFSQDLHQDTSKAKQLFEAASAAKRNNQLEQTIELNEQAAALYYRHGLYEEAFRTKAFNIGYYRILKQYDLAKTKGKTLLEDAEAKLGTQHEQVAVMYSSVANIYSQTADFKTAIEMQLKALYIMKEKDYVNNKKTFKNLRMVYNNLAIAYYFKGNLEEALNYFAQAIQLLEQYSPNDIAALERAYGNIAAIYHSRGQYEETLQYQIKTLSLVSDDNSTASKQETARKYRNIAVTYNEIGASSLALEYLEKAHAIYLSIYGNDHPEMLKIYEVRAVIYNQQKNYEKAVEDLLKGKKILEAQGNELQPLALLYSNLSGIYAEMKQYSLAEKYVHQAIALNTQIGGDYYHRLISNYKNLSAIYILTDRRTAGIEYKHKAIEIIKKTHGQQHPTLASTYTSLGTTFLEDRVFETALDYYQKAIQANLVELSPTVDLKQIIEQEDYLSSIELNRTLRWQARMFLRWYKVTQDSNKLAKALESVQRAKQLADLVRNSLQQSGDKKILLQQTNAINTIAIQVCYHYYQITKDPHYSRLAFKFAEANKSAILLDVLRDRQAKKFGAIPDSIRQQESQLLERIGQLEKDVLHTKLNQQRQKAGLLKEELFDLKRKLDTFYINMQQSYARYANLKTNQKSVQLSALQEQLLDDKTALIEFYLGDSACYEFVITKNSLHFEQIIITKKALKEKVAQLRDALSNYQLVLHQGDQAKSNYVKAASWFYEQLFAPLEPHLNDKNKLVLVPDNVLGYLPFETFLVEKPSLETPYNQFHYLIQDYTVRYGYSSLLLLENQQQRQQKSYTASAKLLAMSSSYPELGATELEQRSYVQQNLRKSLQPIPSVHQELKVLEGIFTHGAFYSHGSANEANFKATIAEEDYNIIHLAMHGILNTNQPIASSLAFTENGDSLEDNFLYAYEISQLNLNTDLVVLSACETGYGKFEQGEGVLSLARSFTYAGVPALVVSLWQVNDATTAIIMEYFYQYLKDGMSIDEALAAAKRAYIQQVDLGVATHPAYWAPFVHLGDAQAIVQTHNTWWWYLLVAFGLGAGLFWWRSRRQSE